jgi:hypothetical protein
LGAGCVAAGLALTSVLTPAAPGTPARSPQTVAREIDREIDQSLTESKVGPSPLADDAEFLRRVSLDLIGRIPTLERTVAFLDSKDPDKRAKLIDELLASPEYGRHMATIWHNLIVPRDSMVRRVPTQTFHDWLAESFNAGRGWNQIVYELLTADGPGEDNPQVAFVISNIENNRVAPNKLTASTAQLFLGVQLNCAECHNHPFTKWKQTDFWSIAAFFSRTKLDGNPQQAAKAGGLPGVSESAVAQRFGKAAKGAPVPVTTGASILIPESKGKVVSAKFLEGAEPNLGNQGPYRPALAQWITARDNKFFAPAMVNRMWAHFFGRGFVNPIDDFHSANPASHPLLLKSLAREFADSGFDLKHLIRCICNSKTYQRSSRPNPTNEHDNQLFARMNIKMMTPEVLYDSLMTAMGASAAADARPARGQPVAKNQQGGKTGFVAFFNTSEDGADVTEYTHGIPQVLRLMNSAQFNNGGALVARVARGGVPRDKAIEQIYLATLNRRPTATEVKRLSDYVGKQGSVQQGYAGVVWILLNSSEFVLNH